MLLTAQDVAKMIDMSCVRTISRKADIDEMVRAVLKYKFTLTTDYQACFSDDLREINL